MRISRLGNSDSLGDLTADTPPMSLSRQRSLSGDLSPSQSRESILETSVFRSSSDSNLVLDPDKKGIFAHFKCFLILLQII